MLLLSIALVSAIAAQGASAEVRMSSKAALPMVWVVGDSPTTHQAGLQAGDRFAQLFDTDTAHVYSVKASAETRSEDGTSMSLSVTLRNIRADRKIERNMVCDGSIRQVPSVESAPHIGVATVVADRFWGLRQ